MQILQDFETAVISSKIAACIIYTPIQQIREQDLFAFTRYGRLLKRLRIVGEGSSPLCNDFIG